MNLQLILKLKREIQCVRTIFLKFVSRLLVSGYENRGDGYMVDIIVHH